MDNLVEQVVKRKKNSRYYMNIILIVLVAISIPATLMACAFIFEMAYFSYVSLFVGLFCIYGAWFFISSLKVDYEYATFSGVLKIDKVIANRRRRKVLKLYLKDIEELFEYSDEEMSKHNFRKVFSVAENDYSKGNYIMVFSIGKNKYAVDFMPNEELLKAMRPYLPREVARTLYK